MQTQFIQCFKRCPIIFFKEISHFPASWILRKLLLNIWIDHSIWRELEKKGSMSLFSDQLNYFYSFIINTCPKSIFAGPDMDFQTEQMTSVWIHLLWMQLIQRAIVLFISQNLEGFIRFCPGLTVNCLFQKVVPIFLIWRIKYSLVYTDWFFYDE